MFVSISAHIDPLVSLFFVRPAPAQAHSPAQPCPTQEEPLPIQSPLPAGIPAKRCLIADASRGLGREGRWGGSG